MPPGAATDAKQRPGFQTFYNLTRMRFRAGYCPGTAPGPGAWSGGSPGQFSSASRRGTTLGPSVLPENHPINAFALIPELAKTKKTVILLP